MKVENANSALYGKYVAVGTCNGVYGIPVGVAEEDEDQVMWEYSLLVSDTEDGAGAHAVLETSTGDDASTLTFLGTLTTPNQPAQVMVRDADYHVVNNYMNGLIQ